MRPPSIDDVELGFRVLMLMISPYARRGMIDDALSDFSSPLRFIADNWDLPYLTSRIRGSHNYEHAFDFRTRPRRASPLPRVRATNRFWDFPEAYPGWVPGLRVEEPKIRYP